MNCFYHGDRPANNFCNNCGKPLCDECKREVKGRIYCEDCLYGAISSQERLKAIENRSPIPGISLLLAFLPGLGAIYNGEYLKAIFQFVIFCSLIFLANITGFFLFGLGAALYYFYTIFDAYKSANEIRIKGRKIESESKSVGVYRGVFLILLGILFLLNNFGLLSFSFMKIYWPFLLIVLGAYLIYREVAQKNKKEEIAKVDGGEEKNE